MMQLRLGKSYVSKKLKQNTKKGFKNMKPQNVLIVLLHRSSSMIFISAFTRYAFVCTALVFWLFSSSVPAATDNAKGTLVHKNRTVTLRYAYLIKGPDAIDTNTIIRRLILSEQDIGVKIQNCKTMSCADNQVTEGIIVDLISGPRIGYWMAIKDGLVQHSGTLKPVVLKTSFNDAKRLVGKLSFDDTSAGGPKVEAGFDSSMLKEFTSVH